MKDIILATKNNSIKKHIENILELTGYKYKIIDKLDKLAEVLKSKKDFILILHYNFFNENTEDFLNNCKDLFPFIKIILISDIPNTAEGIKVLNLGIKAYGNSRMSKAHLIQAISFVEEGNIWLYPDFIKFLIKSHSKTNNKSHKEVDLSILSNREKEIVDYISQGFSNKEIASKAHISERTVKAHLTSIYSKLGVTDRLSLAAMIK